MIKTLKNISYLFFTVSVTDSPPQYVCTSTHIANLVFRVYMLQYHDRRKTELCKNYEARGYCPYGSNCAVRSLPDIPSAASSSI